MPQSCPRRVACSVRDGQAHRQVRGMEDSLQHSCPGTNAACALHPEDAIGKQQLIQRHVLISGCVDN